MKFEPIIIPSGVLWTRINLPLDSYPTLLIYDPIRICNYCIHPSCRIDKLKFRTIGHEVFEKCPINKISAKKLTTKSTSTIVALAGNMSDVRHSVDHIHSHHLHCVLFLNNFSLAFFLSSCGWWTLVYIDLAIVNPD